ncbi:flagellar filament capping protein FliD [Geodermatophilus sabuli]|uniref:Flagellar hook-associated protein 2 n=1 Tax=Geodermatophilus sabuli TaxID=1564158 RepID=A0A7K3VZP8_9ACTN|nr:flagellar filament capping protein FliD [Geodermatophilus sabuli]NEK57838.1 flagellar filament capping protein FliD [Geodermatophilus sabuli]
MTVDGMISGLDTTSLINSLVQAEGAPQAQLKTRLSTTTASANAYRSINTRFDAVRAAAETLTKPETWAMSRASSSTNTVTASLGSAPQTGSLAFSVEKLASSHAVITNGTPFGSTADNAGFGSSIQVLNKDGSSRGTPIAIGGTGSLADVVTAINGSTDAKLSATAVQVSPGKYQLQVTSKETGAAAEFSLAGQTMGIVTPAGDAQLKVGTGPGAYDVFSATNSFVELMPGATIAVSKADPGVQVTVGVTADPEGVAAKVKSLVDAINSALGGIKTFTAAEGGPAAVLKGDSALMNLSGRVLTAVSDAVGSSGSPAAAGLQLQKDGTVLFDAGKFAEKLKADPALVQKLFTGTPADGGAAAVKGVVQRVHELAKSSTDVTTGTLTLLAQGRDALAKNIQTRIEAWDLRLAQRRDTLTRQFTAMETALSSMKNQSSWLAGQISSLPSYS